jgi:hypothetical protein
MMFGAFTNDELQALKKDRSHFPKAAEVGRGGQFQPWRNGAMQGVGSRMPSGGRAGDTYTVYPSMQSRGDDIERVRKIFKYAKVRSFSYQLDYADFQITFRISRGSSRKWRLTPARSSAICAAIPSIVMP